MPHPSRPNEAQTPLTLLGRFPHAIGVYGHLPPFANTQVDVFEAATAHRLRVLHFLDEKFGLDSSTNPAVLRTSSNATPAAAAAAAAAVNGAASAAAAKPLYVQLEEMLQEGGLMLPPAVAATAPESKRQQVAERDAISHFALRIAFSRSREKQQWLIQQESRLLMYRFDRLCAFRELSDGSRSLVADFLQQENLAVRDLPDLGFFVLVVFSLDSTVEEPAASDLAGFEYHMISRIPRPRDPTGNSPAEALWRQATGFLRGPVAQQAQQLYLVPCFPDAGQLVRNRRVYVQNMMAYVPDTELDSVVCGRLRCVRFAADARSAAMSRSFELLESRQGTLENTVFSDPRVGKLLQAAPTVYLGRDFNKAALESTEERLTPQSIKHVFKASFPPCMRRLYEAYMAEHHLRHGGRMQLWLFFKVRSSNKQQQTATTATAITAITATAATAATGAAATAATGAATGEAATAAAASRHAYNVRHMYGLEGKRTNYAPMRCSQIIAGNVIGLACKELFIQTHAGNSGDEVGNHPNAFFAASRRYFAAAAKGQQAPSTAAATAATAASPHEGGPPA
ncbi:hypothetical protein ACSSS7_004987 [Eimeria intestinalis]